MKNCLSQDWDRWPPQSSARKSLPSPHGRIRRGGDSESQSHVWSVCERVCMRSPMHTRGSQRSILVPSVTLHLILSWNLGLTNWPVSPKEPPVPASQSILPHPVHTATPNFSPGCWGTRLRSLCLYKHFTHLTITLAPRVFVNFP